MPQGQRMLIWMCRTGLPSDRRSIRKSRWKPCMIHTLQVRLQEVLDPVLPTIEDLAAEIRLLVFQFYYLCSVGDEAPGETQGGHQSPRSRQASRPSDRKETSESSKRKRSQRSIPSKGTDVEHQDDYGDNGYESLPPAKRGEMGSLHDLRRNFGCWFYKWAPHGYPQCAGANGKIFHSFRRVCAPLSHAV